MCILYGHQEGLICTSSTWNPSQVDEVYCSNADCLSVSAAMHHSSLQALDKWAAIWAVGDACTAPHPVPSTPPLPEALSLL